MEIKDIRECDISQELHAEIAALKKSSFSAYQNCRSYYKQLPHFRFLAINGGTLVGQMGIDHRMISVGGMPLSIFGVIDLCVHGDYRGNGLGGTFVESGR